MAVALEDVESWLPTEFLTEEEVLLMDNHNYLNTTTPKGLTAQSFKPTFSFPSEFPYEYDSFGSPGESAEGESSDEDDFLAGLTRRLSQQLAVKPEKWVLSGSPESTLSGIGSWSASSNGSPNGVLSPPTTPFGAKNDTWNLIYEAAGQVARLKMNGENHKCMNYHQGRGLLGPARTQNPVAAIRSQNNSGCYPRQIFGPDVSQMGQYQRQEQVPKLRCSSPWSRQQMKVGLHTPQPNPQHFHNQQHQIPNRVGRTSAGFENGRCVRPIGLSHSAWPSLQVAQNQNQQHPQHQLQHSSSGMRAVFLDGSGVKRESTGTGVFLPRRYGNNPPEPKKTACSTVLLPAKVVHALNLNFEDMNVSTQGQPRLNCSFASDYDIFMARKNALLAQQQQKRSIRAENVVNHELGLPQEWTY